MLISFLPAYRWICEVMTEMMKMIKRVENNELVQQGVTKCPGRLYPLKPSAFLLYWSHLSWFWVVPRLPRDLKGQLPLPPYLK